jgi:hypothetical protein
VASPRSKKPQHRHGGLAFLQDAGEVATGMGQAHAGHVRAGIERGMGGGGDLGRVVEDERVSGGRDPGGAEAHRAGEGQAPCAAEPPFEGRARGIERGHGACREHQRPGREPGEGGCREAAIGADAVEDHPAVSVEHAALVQRLEEPCERVVQKPCLALRQDRQQRPGTAAHHLEPRGHAVGGDISCPFRPVERHQECIALVHEEREMGFSDSVEQPVLGPDPRHAKHPAVSPDAVDLRERLPFPRHVGSSPPRLRPAPFLSCPRCLGLSLSREYCKVMESLRQNRDRGAWATCNKRAAGRSATRHGLATFL